jgi:hypothetical protein
MNESNGERAAAGESNFAPKWSPRGLAQRWRKTIRAPGDFPLALKIGYFLRRAPAALESLSLPALLGQLRAAPRPAARDLVAGVERINRLQNAWLRLPFFRARDNCYLRTLTLYRYLDPGRRDMRVHFVVDPAEKKGERLKGHAWVTVDGQVVGGSPPDLSARAKPIYTFPPAGAERERGAS